MHGRSICRNRTPDCDACPLAAVCPESHMASDSRSTYVVELRR
jgi:endonuclease III